MRVAAPSVLDAVGNAAIREHAQTIEREAGASAVTNEPLAALIVVGFDPDRRVEIEAVEVRDEAAAAALGFEPAVAVLLRSGAPRIESLECAAADGELSASIHRAELGGLVRSLPSITALVGRVRAALAPSCGRGAARAFGESWGDADVAPREEEKRTAKKPDAASPFVASGEGTSPERGGGDDSENAGVTGRGRASGTAS